MGKGKQTKQQPASIPNISQALSVEKQIEIQAEAYYQALKRIERDKDQQESYGDKSKHSNKNALLLFIKLLFVPKHLNDKKIRLQIADGLLNILITLVMDIIGYSLRFFAIAFWSYAVFKLFTTHVALTDAYVYIIFFTIGLFLLVLGGIFNASSKELSKLTDKAKLYAYSSGIMASLAVIISIISLILSSMMK